MMFLSPFLCQYELFSGNFELKKHENMNFSIQKQAYSSFFMRVINRNTRNRLFHRRYLSSYRRYSWGLYIL